MDFLKAFGLFFGRLCISLEFLWPTIAKILNWQESSLYMEAREIPHVTPFLVIAIILQTLGGLLLFFGYYTRLGAILLMIFLTAAIFLFHDFWNLNGLDRLVQQVMFMKDIAILGGLLYVLVNGPGVFSIDKFPEGKSSVDS